AKFSISQDIKEERRDEGKSCCRKETSHKHLLHVEEQD
ncbi:unnamed protein product, partial [marine sediment metagenome]